VRRLLRSAKFWLLTGLAVLAVGLVVVALTRPGDDRVELRLDELLARVEAGAVEEVSLDDGDHRVDGVLRNGTEFRTEYPAEFGDELVTVLDDAEPPIRFETGRSGSSLWWGLAYSLLPILLLVGVVVFLMSSMQGGGKLMQFGRSRARQRSKDQPDVGFADVAGCDEAVEELREIKEFLEDPARFAAVGARIPKGVLLFGPPGTGKTLLARAVAGEAGVPFFSISGSDFVEMFVGVGASRVRDLFEKAKKAAPAIVFIDEIDAVGRHRGAGLGGGHDEREQTLNQMLVEMDGFDVSTGVIMIAATNRPDILDPALLRPGRFDRQIVVDRPDLAGRRAIAAVHARGKPLAEDVSVDLIARRTPGFTGADIANLLNEAALLSVRRDKDLIGTLEVGAAIDRVIAGPERRSRVMSEHEKRVTAYHEAGHALVGQLLPHTDDIHKVSIIARGRALGWTLSLPTEDRYTRTRSELRDELAFLLGGRTAEELVFGEPTTGAANDIERATQIARAMVTEFGMSDSLGPQRLGHAHGEVFLGKEVGHEPNYSEQIAALIDVEVRGLLDDAHDEARHILTRHRATLDRLADALIERETLEEDELRELLGPLGTWTGTGSRAESPVLGSPRSLDVVASDELGPRPFGSDE
jgi:cell division protease FtsH